MTDLIFQKVAGLIAVKGNIPIDKISLDSKFSDLDIDSLTAFSLIYDFEKEFNVSLPNEDVMKIKTIRDVVESFEKLGVTV